MVNNKYDPRQKKYEELEATFCCGEMILKELLDELKPGKDDRLSKQSWIITGPRGVGKSHLLSLLYRHILEDKELSAIWIPLIFPEELFSVDSLYRLLLVIFDELLKNNNVKENNSFELIKDNFRKIKKQKIEGNLANKEEQKHQLAKKLLELLIQTRIITQKKMIFMLENLQSLFKEQLPERDLKHLRSFLNERPDIFIITGTALTVFDEIEEYGKPFYHFFKIRAIESLDKKGIITFLNKIAAFRRENDIIEEIKKNRHHIYVYRLLTGGNPRLVLFLYDLLLDSKNLSTELIMSKITELTPYFLDKIRHESPQKKLILNCLAIQAPAQTPSEIADYSNEDQRSVSEQLKRLKAQGWVKDITIKAEGVKQTEVFYMLSDYFYRIWYKVRNKSIDESEIYCLAEMAAILLGRKEIESRVKRYSRTRDENQLLYEKTLSLIDDEKFMKSITLLIEESKKSENKEIEYLTNKINEYFKKKDWKNFVSIGERLMEYPEIQQKKVYNYLQYGYLKLGNKEKFNEYAGMTENVKPDDIKNTALDYIDMDDLREPQKLEEVRTLSKQQEKYFVEGQNLNASGEHLKAIECYKKMIEIIPKNYEANFYMGYSYFSLDDYSKAIDCFKKASQIKPQEDIAWTYIGSSYYHMGDVNEAIKYLEKATGINPKSHKAWHTLGAVYRDKGKRDKAIECWCEAIKIEPTKYQSLYNLGIEYLEMEDYIKAIEYLNKTVDIKPFKIDAWFNMGVCYDQVNNLKEAIKSYEKAIEISPNNYQSWFNMGIDYLELEHYEEALRCFQKTIELNRFKIDAWFNMGICHDKSNNPQKAIECYNEAASIYPYNYEVWENMGEALYKLKDYMNSYNSYSEFIHYALDFKGADFLKISQLEIIAASIFNSDQEMKRLQDKKNNLETRIESLCRLILQRKLTAAAASFDLILKENILPGFESKKLEFLLKARILDILKTGLENEEIKPLVKYWIALNYKLRDGKAIKDKFLELIYHYLAITDEADISIDIVDGIIEQLYDEGIEISDVIIKIIRALKDPNSREAQTWMADPLFAEVFIQLVEKQAPVMLHPNLARRV